MNILVSRSCQSVIFNFHLNRSYSKNQLSRSGNTGDKEMKNTTTAFVLSHNVATERQVVSRYRYCNIALNVSMEFASAVKFNIFRCHLASS